jgi:hypothetical protein
MTILCANWRTKIFHSPERHACEPGQVKKWLSATWGQMGPEKSTKRQKKEREGSSNFSALSEGRDYAVNPLRR